MTKTEIIAMAREAGFSMENSAAILAAERFAELVAAKEREAAIRARSLSDLSPLNGIQGVGL